MHAVHPMLPSSQDESLSADRGCFSNVPHSGAPTFHEESTCLTQLTLGSVVVQIWSCNTPEFGPNEIFVLDHVAIPGSITEPVHPLLPSSHDNAFPGRVGPEATRRASNTALWIFSARTSAGSNFVFFFTLVTGPRRSLGLKLSDTRVYEPPIRAEEATLKRCTCCPHRHRNSLRDRLVDFICYLQSTEVPRLL